MILVGLEWCNAALAGGFAYEVAVLSFLSGMWWGQALARTRSVVRATTEAYILAVLPSLLAVALFQPWSFGWGQPCPALLYLGALVMLSSLVNRALGESTRDFPRLRSHPSMGRGMLTIVVGLLAPRVL